MKVRELIRELHRFSLDAEVCVEVCEEPQAHVIQEYDLGDKQYVYIADSTEYIDTVIDHTAVKTVSYTEGKDGY